LNAVFLEWMKRLQKCVQVDGEYVGWAKKCNILKLILIVRFACATLDVGHPVSLDLGHHPCGFRDFFNVPEGGSADIYGSDGHTKGLPYGGPRPLGLSSTNDRRKGTEKLIVLGPEKGELKATNAAGYGSNRMIDCL
jgi:hypothetical protein